MVGGTIQKSAQRSTYQTSSSQSSHHRSLCHPCLTSGETVEFEDKAQLDARFISSRTRGMESTDGAEETHSQSPRCAQVSSCHRRCHGRDCSTQQRSIIVSDGSTLSRSVGVRSSFILSSCISVGAQASGTALTFTHAIVSLFGAGGATPRPRHGRCRHLPSGKSDTDGLFFQSMRSRSSTQTRPMSAPALWNRRHKGRGQELQESSQNRSKIELSVVLIPRRKRSSMGSQALCFRSPVGSGSRVGGDARGNEPGEVKDSLP